jgi:lysophospholipase L1-like esterase
MFLKISAAATLVMSIALSSAAPLAGTANAAQVSAAAQTASAAPGGVPPAMPVISRGLPAFTNDDCGGAIPASRANDNIYDDGWRACGTPSPSAPIYLAYDLSSVPAAQRGAVLVVWYNDPATIVYDYTFRSSVNPQPPGCTTNCGWEPFDIPRDYTLEANAASGGSLPASGWVTLASVTGNNYHSRQHAVDLTGYNWVRINVTAADGNTPNTSGVVLNMDVHNASAGYRDDWIFYGDSITEGSMHHYDHGGTFAQQISPLVPGHFPAQEAGAIGGTLSNDGASSINAWLSLFSGSYVAIAYGTNDAGFCCSANVSPTIFYNNYVGMVQAVLAQGKTPIIPKIPWGCTSQILTYVPQLNQQIDALYTAFPQVVHGPDLWAFFNANQSLIGPDCIHPTDAGYTALRQQWVNTAVATVYTPPPALQISNVQTSSVGSSSAVITWTTNNTASSKVDYGTTTAYGSNVADAATVTSHSMTLTGLTPNTTYHYAVSGVDGWGQSAASPDATFATTIVVGPASHLAVATAATPTAGTPFSFTVIAQDDAGNTATDYAGTVHFTTTDTSTKVVLPADAKLVNGQGTFSATLIKAGAQTITATDTTTATITGTLSVTVRAAAAAQMLLTTPKTTTALTPFPVTVTLVDAFGNMATSYRGTVHFTSSDLLATLPADTTFTAADGGKHQFSVTLVTPPGETVSVRDIANSSLGTTSGVISVTTGLGIGGL